MTIMEITEITQPGILSRTSLPEPDDYLWQRGSGQDSWLRDLRDLHDGHGGHGDPDHW